MRRAEPRSSATRCEARRPGSAAHASRPPGARTLGRSSQRRPENAPAKRCLSRGERCRRRPRGRRAAVRGAPRPREHAFVARRFVEPDRGGDHEAVFMRVNVGVDPRDAEPQAFGLRLRVVRFAVDELRSIVVRADVRILIRVERCRPGWSGNDRRIGRCPPHRAASRPAGCTDTPDRILELKACSPDRRRSPPARGGRGPLGRPRAGFGATPGGPSIAP
jgi:hypothetical protein